MAKPNLVKANEKIAEKVVAGHKKVENAVVGGYKKIEGAFVEGYEKIENAFVDRYLTRDGESTEDAKERLHAKQGERQAQTQEQCSSHAAQSPNYARMAQERAMEHVKAAQEMAHTPGHDKK